MNARFKPQSTRECMEGISAPLSHFATCKYDHGGVYNQAAQSKKFNRSVDASFWSRTSNIWSARVPRDNTGSSHTEDTQPTWLLAPGQNSKKPIRLTRSLYIRSAAAAAALVAVLGFYFWPASQQTTPSTGRVNTSTARTYPVVTTAPDTTPAKPEPSRSNATAPERTYTTPQKEKAPTPAATATPTEPAATTQPAAETVTPPTATETPNTTTPSPSTTTPPTEPSNPVVNNSEIIPPIL